MRSGSAKWSLSHRIARRDALGRGTGRSDLAKPRPLLAGEHAVGDLADHERGQRPDVARALEQAHEPEDGVEQGRLDRAHGQLPRGRCRRVEGGAVGQELPDHRRVEGDPKDQTGGPGDASTTWVATGRSTDTSSNWAGSYRYTSPARSTCLLPCATMHSDGS